VSEQYIRLFGRNSCSNANVNVQRVTRIGPDAGRKDSTRGASTITTVHVRALSANCLLLCFQVNRRKQRSEKRIHVEPYSAQEIHGACCGGPPGGFEFCPPRFCLRVNPLPQTVDLSWLHPLSPLSHFPSTYHHHASLSHTRCSPRCRRTGTHLSRGMYSSRSTLYDSHPCGAWRARFPTSPLSTDHPSLFDQHYGSLEGLHIRSQDGTQVYKITNYHGTCGLMIKKTCHLRGSGNGAGIKSGEVSTADLLYSVAHEPP
jgi:hypothetical protein